MRTQTLVMTVFRTVEHVSRLIDAVGALIGNMQGNQVLIQTTATISKTLAVMEVQTGRLAAGRYRRPALPGGHPRQPRQDSLKRLEDHPRY